LKGISPASPEPYRQPFGFPWLRGLRLLEIDFQQVLYRRPEGQGPSALEGPKETRMESWRIIREELKISRPFTSFAQTRLAYRG